MFGLRWREQERRQASLSISVQPTSGRIASLCGLDCAWQQLHALVDEIIISLNANQRQCIIFAVVSAYTRLSLPSSMSMRDTVVYFFYNSTLKLVTYTLFVELTPTRLPLNRCIRKSVKGQTRDPLRGTLPTVKSLLNLTNPFGVSIP